jgi:hypothetical protein
MFEIRGILETYRIDLKNSIEYALSHWNILVSFLTWNWFPDDLSKCPIIW